MINYWWVTRPKRKLNSIPEILAVFSTVSLDAQWQGSINLHRKFEDALEEAGLKRVGERRDARGSGGRTYYAWLASLGLVFTQDSTSKSYLTLAGEAIMQGRSPVEILKNQVMKYQFPSPFSLSLQSSKTRVNERFRIRPFRFLIKLLSDNRVQYLTTDEIAKIIIVEAENESDQCYEYIVNRIRAYRSYGDEVLDEDYFIKYAPSSGKVNPEHPFSHLNDTANTIVNWLDYTQLIYREKGGVIKLLDDKRDEINYILANKPAFIDRPENQEYFQRKFGLDPWHQKDTRNLANSKTITSRMIDDLANTSSIFSIVPNTDQTENNLLVDLGQQKIIISLPEKTYQQYYNIQGYIDIQPAMHSMIIVPALVYVFSELRSAENLEEMEYYRWYDILW